jgi:hypothetical protein
MAHETFCFCFFVVIIHTSAMETEPALRKEQKIESVAEEKPAETGKAKDDAVTDNLAELTETDAENVNTAELVNTLRQSFNLTSFDWDGFLGKPDPRFLNMYETSIANLRKVRKLKIGQYLEKKVEVLPSMLPDPAIGAEYKQLFAFGYYQELNIHLMCALLHVISTMHRAQKVESDILDCKYSLVYYAKRLLMFSLCMWNDQQDSEAALVFKPMKPRKGVTKYEIETEADILHKDTNPSVALQLHLFILRFLVAQCVDVQEACAESPVSSAPAGPTSGLGEKRKLVDDAQRKEDANGGATSPSLAVQSSVRHQPPQPIRIFKADISSRKAAPIFLTWPRLEARMWGLWFELMEEHNLEAWLLARKVIFRSSALSGMKYLCPSQYSPGPLCNRSLHNGLVVVNLEELTRVGTLYMEYVIRNDLHNIIRNVNPIPRLFARAALACVHNSVTVGSRAEMVALRMVKYLLYNDTLWNFSSRRRNKAVTEQLTVETAMELGVMPMCQQWMVKRFMRLTDKSPNRLDHDGRVYMFNYLSAIGVPMEETIKFAQEFYKRDEPIDRTIKSVYMANRPGMSCAKMVSARLCPYVKGCTPYVEEHLDIEAMGSVAEGCSHCSASLERSFPSTSAPFNYQVRSPAAFTRVALDRVRGRKRVEIMEEVSEGDLAHDFTDQL